MPKLSLDEIRALFPAGFATVIFDCDSTLSAMEGITALAIDHQAEVAELTEAAMRGEVPLEDVYRLRLDLVRPQKSQMDAVGRLYIENIVEDAADVCRELASANIDIRIISFRRSPPRRPASVTISLHR
jgi:phosphoserine phosphatase